MLGDPALRRAYDRSLDVPDQPSADATSSREWEPAPVPGPPPESSFPWRFLAGLTAVGIGIVLLGVFTYEPSTPGPPDNVLEAGSCVVIEDNGDASEVNCNDDHDGVVESVIGDGDLCPFEFEPHRDRQGLGVVCIRFNV